MSRDGLLRKKSREAFLSEVLRRFGESVDPATLPFSESELRTLAKRLRPFFWDSRKRERLERYQRHLSESHGPELVSRTSSRILEIINRIAWEDK